MAGKKKTTFAKLSREAKIREKRQAKRIRKEQRQLENNAGLESSTKSRTSATSMWLVSRASSPMSPSSGSAPSTAVT